MRVTGLGRGLQGSATWSGAGALVYVPVARAASSVPSCFPTFAKGTGTSRTPKRFCMRVTWGGSQLREPGREILQLVPQL